MYLRKSRHGGAVIIPYNKVSGKGLGVIIYKPYTMTIKHRSISINIYNFHNSVYLTHAIPFAILLSNANSIIYLTTLNSFSHKQLKINNLENTNIDFGLKSKNTFYNNAVLITQQLALYLH